jgi:hypothetical protein
MRAALLLVLALGACTPREYAPVTPAEATSPANGTWSGRVECFPGGGPRLYAELPQVTIADGAMSFDDARARLDGRFNAAGRGDIVGYIRTIDGEWIPLGLDATVRDGSLVGEGAYESVSRGQSGGRSGRVQSARPEDRRGPCKLELARR